jgi:hypothetical protein
MGHAVVLLVDWLKYYDTRRFESRMRWIFFFFNLPYLSSRTMALGVDLASNRNEYQESS